MYGLVLGKLELLMMMMVVVVFLCTESDASQDEGSKLHCNNGNSLPIYTLNLCDKFYLKYVYVCIYIYI